jgi:hypothetical protein
MPVKRGGMILVAAVLVAVTPGAALTQREVTWAAGAVGGG